MLPTIICYLQLYATYNYIHMYNFNIYSIIYLTPIPAVLQIPSRMLIFSLQTPTAAITFARPGEGTTTV